MKKKGKIIRSSFTERRKRERRVRVSIAVVGGAIKREMGDEKEEEKRWE